MIDKYYYIGNKLKLNFFVSYTVTYTVDDDFRGRFLKKNRLKVKGGPANAGLQGSQTLLFICNCFGNKLWLLLIARYVISCLQALLLEVFVLCEWNMRTNELSKDGAKN